MNFKEMDPSMKKLMGYILGMVVIFIVALLLPKSSSNTLNEVEPITIKEEDNILAFLQDREDYTYHYTYTLNIDDEVIVYEGIKNDIEEFSITKEGKTKNYLFKKGLLYESIDDSYKIVNDDVYDSLLELFTAGKYLYDYLELGYLKDNNYIVSLKDVVEGYIEDSYLTISLTTSDDDYTIDIDYTNLLKYTGNNVNIATMKLEYREVVK